MKKIQRSLIRDTTLSLKEKVKRVEIGQKCKKKTDTKKDDRNLKHEES
jgi:hypothetical protein